MSSRIPYLYFPDIMSFLLMISDVEGEEGSRSFMVGKDVQLSLCVLRFISLINFLMAGYLKHLGSFRSFEI